MRTRIGLIVSLALFAESFGPLASAAETMLSAREQAAMLSSCAYIQNQRYRALCHNIVNDSRLSVNSKRSCFDAMKQRLSGKPWEVVERAKATAYCTYYLHAAGYPVKEMLTALAGS